jgi:Sec-independent protein secretion pathway component TatC
MLSGVFVSFNHSSKEMTMKVKSSKNLLLLVLIVMPFVLAFAPSPAQPQAADRINVISIILTISVGFASLIGVSKLVPIIVQFLKVLGIAPDNTANRWAAGLNLLAFIVLVIFGVFQPQLALSVLDGMAGQIAEILLFILGLVVQLTGSKPTYDDLKASRIPLLNFSHTTKTDG